MLCNSEAGTDGVEVEAGPDHRLILRELRSGLVKLPQAILVTPKLHCVQFALHASLTGAEPGSFLVFAIAGIIVAGAALILWRFPRR